MSKLNINIDNHGQKYTVSEMRKRLAEVLSKLDGEQEVTFAFRADLPDYKPRTVRTPRDFSHVRAVIADMRDEEPTIVYGELARPENN